MPGLEAIEWPHALLALGAFVLGSAVGSFLNVCIWRIPRGLSIVSPLRSFCPHCGRPIRARDNVPLVSFALLRARCRDCGAPISWRYPLVEGVTGALFAALYLTQRQGGSPMRYPSSGLRGGCWPVCCFRRCTSARRPTIPSRR